MAALANSRWLPVCAVMTAWRQFLLIRRRQHYGILPFMTYSPHCSFCNQTEQQTGPLLAKMDANVKRHAIRICKSCAEMAIEVIDKEVLRRAGEHPRPLEL